METLRSLTRFFWIAILIISGSNAYSQNSEAANSIKFTEMISRYETSKDMIALFYLQFNGSNDQKVLEWFEKNLDSDVNILESAGQAFSNSKLLPWASKAEATLTKSFQINPTVSTAKNLGFFYLSKDTKKACENFEKAYKINPIATGVEQFAFCLMTDSGSRIFRKSDIEACEIIKNVAGEYLRIYKDMEFWEKGRVFYFYGECLTSNKPALSSIKNTKEAVEWYKRGMNSGHDWSALTYAEHLESGIGVLRDPKGALQAYIKSATLGLNVAQNRLGVIYAEGELVPKNIPEAYKWFLIATANGYEAAKDNRVRAESRLSRAEIRNAEGSAKQWLKENPQ
jgi:hypothetical protein